MRGFRNKRSAFANHTSLLWLRFHSDVRSGHVLGRYTAITSIGYCLTLGAMPTVLRGYGSFGSLMPVQSHRHGTHFLTPFSPNCDTALN